MRWFGAFLFSLWLICAAHAQTFVQKAVSADPSVASTTVSVTISAGGTGDIIMGAVGSQSSGVTLSSVKDNNGVTYTVVDNVNDSTNGQQQWSFYKENISGAPTSIVATFNASVLARIQINEWSGIATTTPLDGHNGQIVTAVGTVYTLPSFTTVANGDLIYAAATTDSVGSSTMTAGSITNATATLRNAGTGTQNAYDETGIQSTAASTSVTLNTSVSGSTSVFVAMAFKAAAGGGPTCPATLALMGVGC